MSKISNSVKIRSSGVKFRSLSELFCMIWRVSIYIYGIKKKTLNDNYDDENKNGMNFYDEFCKK